MRVLLLMSVLLLSGCADQHDARLRAWCETHTPGQCAFIGQGVPVMGPMGYGPGPVYQTLQTPPMGTLVPTAIMGEYYVTGQPYGTVHTSPR